MLGFDVRVMLKLWEIYWELSKTLLWHLKTIYSDIENFVGLHEYLIEPCKSPSSVPMSFLNKLCGQLLQVC